MRSEQLPSYFCKDIRVERFASVLGEWRSTIRLIAGLVTVQLLVLVGSTFNLHSLHSSNRRAHSLSFLEIVSCAEQFSGSFLAVRLSVFSLSAKTSGWMPQLDQDKYHYIL